MPFSSALSICSQVCISQRQTLNRALCKSLERSPRSCDGGKGTVVAVVATSAEPAPSLSAAGCVWACFVRTIHAGQNGAFDISGGLGCLTMRPVGQRETV